MFRVKKDGIYSEKQFEAVRFGVSTTQGTRSPHIVGVKTGTYPITYDSNNPRYKSGGFHITGAGGKDMQYIHNSAPDWTKSLSAVTGCVGIGGSSTAWSDFKSFIFGLDKGK